MVHTMLKSQTLAIRASTIREKLNLLSNSTEDLTDEQRAEVDTLSTEYRDVEVKLRGALVSEDDAKAKAATNGDLDGERKELRELKLKASVGVIVAAALEHRSVSGAEKEIQDHFQVSGDEVPLELLADEGEEVRAVSVSPGNHQVSQRPIVPPVFAMGDAAFLERSRQERLAAGDDSVFRYLSTTRPDRWSVQTGIRRVIAETTSGHSRRMFCSPFACAMHRFSIRETDAIRFPMMDSALRSALSMGLSRSHRQGAHRPDSNGRYSNVAATAADTFASYRSRFVIRGRRWSVLLQWKVDGQSCSSAPSHVARYVRALPRQQSADDSSGRFSPSCLRWVARESAYRGREPETNRTCS